MTRADWLTWLAALGVEPQHLGDRIVGAEEEPAEDPVVDGDVVPAADQHAASGPVQVG